LLENPDTTKRMKCPACKKSLGLEGIVPNHTLRDQVMNHIRMNRIKKSQEKTGGTSQPVTASVPKEKNERKRQRDHDGW
jgi:hypothetical protein